jgi:hypothetical protein
LASNAVGSLTTPEIVGLGALALLLLVVFYFLPTLVARFRKHPDVSGIALFNLGYGWTGFGWLATLMWALRTSPPKIFTGRRSANPPPEADS